MFLIDYIDLFNYYLMYTLSHVLGITFCSVCIDACIQVLSQHLLEHHLVPA